MVDSLLRLSIVPNKDGRRKLSIQSRFGVGELGDEITITLSLPVGEYHLVNSDAEVDGDILAIVESGPITSAVIKERMAEGEGDISSQAVTRRLTKLWKDGRLERTGSGKALRYSVPENQSIAPSILTRLIG